MLHSEPRVLNRFQYREYRIEGRFALAAIAKASETRKATFCSAARMPPMIETPPITTAVRRATRTSCAEVALPSLITPL